MGDWKLAKLIYLTLKEFIVTYLMTSFTNIGNKWFQKEQEKNTTKGNYCLIMIIISYALLHNILP